MTYICVRVCAQILKKCHLKLRHSLLEMKSNKVREQTKKRKREIREC